jgi:hypothetical protein
MQSGAALHQIPHESCEKTVGDLLSFETDLGSRDWQAIQRWVGIRQLDETV